MLSAAHRSDVCARLSALVEIRNKKPSCSRSVSTRPAGNIQRVAALVASLLLAVRQVEQAMKEYASALIICCAIFYATVLPIGPPAGGW